MGLKQRFSPSAWSIFHQEVVDDFLSLPDGLRRDTLLTIWLWSS